MKMLNTAFDADGFFTRLRESDRSALIIDFDGTLAPFRVARDEVEPYPGVREIIGRIARARRCRVVLVSGRSARDVAPLAGFEPLPEIWGCHGWERLLPDGSYRAARIDDRGRDGLAEARAWIEERGLSSRCERKVAALALHWRDLAQDERERLREAVGPRWSEIASRTGLRLREFNGGLELRPPGRDKGSAVRTILEEEPAGIPAAYLGDDDTDEDAFAALGGRGLAVLVNEEFHETAADLWLTPPGELLSFLSRWSDACGGSDASAR